MSYQSIDSLQNTLKDAVFQHTTPEEHEIGGLREALNILKDKNWR